jgi:PAS domain S-box-containing protein
MRRRIPSGVAAGSPRVLLGWGLLAALLCTGPLVAEPPPERSPLRVVLDDNYAPYVFRNAQGELQGILPDEWALWQEKTGISVDLMAMGWKDTQRYMKSGQADVIDTIFHSDGRTKYYDFTPPYVKIDVPVFTHITLSGVTNLSSLSGVTLGVKKGDFIVGHLKNTGIKNIQEYASYDAIIQALLAQEIKAFSIDKPAAMYYLYKHGLGDEYRERFVVCWGEFHRAVKKGNTELLTLVMAGFDQISPDEHRAIRQKWIGVPISWQAAIRRWRPLILLGAGLVLLLLVGNIILRAQVRNRTRELRQALKDLQQGKGRIKNILQLSPVGIGVIRHRNIQETNDILCEMTGYTHQEMLGQSTRLFYPTQEEYERVGHEFYKQIAQQGVASLEIHGLRKNGDHVHWILNGTPVDSTHPDEAIIFTALDITNRKIMEQELRNSREYFSSVFNSINEAILVQEANSSQILDVNARMCEMYGYSREQALTVGLGALCPGVSPYSLAEAAEWARKAREEGPQMFEWQAQHGDGHLFWVEMYIRKVILGSQQRLVVTARNISDRKVAEEERLKFERRIQEAQKLESLGLLAGGIAHDFNNLLAAILGNIDLALLEIPASSPAHGDIQSAVVATQRAADLVQQMLAYAGKGQFRIESVDIAATVQETVRILQASISKNAHLRYQLPSDLPPINADVTQIRQVIMNLVINASESLEGRSGILQLSAGTMEGNELGSVHVWPHEPLDAGVYAYIEASDCGVGIRPEVLDRIFDPFFSTKFTGRGLGLAAVLGIVRSHKGAIRVDSTLGKGSTFRVLFPANPSGKPHPASLLVTPQPRLPRGNGKLILLVDDEPSLRETGAKLLDRLGYRVTCATDGEHAIHLFHTQAPELAGVILDLTMPGMDGVETLLKLREIRPDIPVLVSSGHSEQEVRQRFKDQTLNGFISKPYSLDGLQRALASTFSE